MAIQAQTTLKMTERHRSLRRRYVASESTFQAYRNKRSEIEHYTGPVDENDTGRSDLFDFTAIDGREKLAASIHGSLVPQSVKWFSGTYRKKNGLNKNPEAAKYRDEVIEEAFNTIGSSDFYLEMAGLIQEATGAGNGLMGVEPLYSDEAETDLDTIDFTSIPTDQARWECDRRGDIRTFWWEFDWEPSQIVDFCQSKKFVIPDDIAKKLEAGQRDLIKIVYCVFPRENILKRKKLQYPATPENRPWGCMWWREDTGAAFYREEDGKIENGYYEKPIHLLRWSKKSGKVTGYGPGHIALPTVKFVNSWMEFYLKHAEKAVDPPTLGTNRNALTEIDHRPGRHTLVRDVDEIKEMPSASDFPLAEKIIEMLMAQIRAIFRTDDLQLKESPAMTAMEVQVRYEIMNRLLGKTLTFIQQFLGSVIHAVISMLMRTGRLSAPPKVVRDAGGVMTIEYQGPLARSQRTDEVAAVERWVTMIYGMSQFEPRIRAAIDPQKIAEYIRDRLGIPADLMPDTTSMMQRMAAIDQMQADAMKAAAMKDAAAAEKDKATAEQTRGSPGGPPSVPTSPLLPVRPALDLTTGRAIA